MPDACRLLDVHGLEPPSAEAVVSRWINTGRSTFVVIGECYDGAVPFQAARVGGLRPGTAVVTRPWIVPVEWSCLGRPEPQRPAARRGSEEVTDLRVLVG